MRRPATKSGPETLVFGTISPFTATSNAIYSSTSHRRTEESPDVARPSTRPYGPSERHSSNNHLDRCRLTSAVHGLAVTPHVLVDFVTSVASLSQSAGIAAPPPSPCMRIEGAALALRSVSWLLFFCCLTFYILEIIRVLVRFGPHYSLCR